MVVVLLIAILALSILPHSRTTTTLTDDPDTQTVEQPETTTTVTTVRTQPRDETFVPAFRELSKDDIRKLLVQSTRHPDEQWVVSFGGDEGTRHAFPIPPVDGSDRPGFSLLDRDILDLIVERAYQEADTIRIPGLWISSERRSVIVEDIRDDILYGSYVHLDFFPPIVEAEYDLSTLDSDIFSGERHVPHVSLIEEFVRDYPGRFSVNVRTFTLYALDEGEEDISGVLSIRVILHT